MSAPQVAVVITCYNLGRTLREALHSAESQSLQPAEIVVVDDGSDDLFTRQTLEQLRREGRRVLSLPNGGVGRARNTGIRATTAPFVVLLDADDILETTYLAKAAARFAADPGLDFVSCGMRCFGGSDETWTPQPPDLVASFTRGVVHVSTMFRRQLWAAVGGFDESFDAHEDVDFWTSAVARGCRGDVLDELLLRYRVREGSNYRHAIRPENHLRLMRRLYEKHLPMLGRDAEELLLAKEAFILEQRDHQQHLEQRQASLRAELAQLHAEIHQTLEELRPLGGQRVDFGDLRRLAPISPVWGQDRGMPLDRYYIHGFLARQRTDIRGRVLEIKDSRYAQMFGDDRLASVDVLDIDRDNPLATIVADLTCATGIPDDTYDCVILTQTLGLIFEPAKALAHTYRILKPGGVLLCTVPASGRISYEPPGLDGDHWRFTEASLRRLFAAEFRLADFEIGGHGNVLANAAFLYGLAPDELEPDELDAHDPYFPVVYTVRAVKAERRVDAATSMRERAPSSPTKRGATSAILMYHRVGDRLPTLDRLGISADDLRHQMRQLARSGHDVLPLADLATAARRGELSRPTVAITFDDGYVDHLERAAEILGEHGFPATYFVVGTALEPPGRFWWSALERILRPEASLPGELELELASGSLRLETAPGAARERAFHRLCEILIQQPRAIRDESMRQIERWSGPEAGAAPRVALSETELTRLASIPGAEIGAHTENHLWLPAQSDAVRRFEIGATKLRLEALLDSPVRSFAYPYGGHDARTVELVREAGFELAVTTEERPLSAADEPLRLPRFDAGSWSAAEFASRLDRALGK